MALLRYDEFLDEAPEERGKSVRVNHDSDDCSGNSNSLKIERKEDGTVSAHCFRCGRSGFYADDFQRIKEARQKLANSDSRHEPATHGSREPSDSTGRTAEWPTYASRWLKQWGITNDEISTHHIGYSNRVDRCIFPVHFDGKYQGYVSRAVNPKDERPKWLMYAKGKPWQTTCDTKTRNILVLVEDIVSGIRVGRYADCIALLTTTISTDILPLIANYDEYIVWLDDDNRQVKLNQLKLARRLSMFGNVRVVHTTDPKRCSDEFVRSTIEEQTTTPTVQEPQDLPGLDYVHE